MRPADETATRMLRRASQGEAAAVDLLLPIVYEELRSLAARHLQHERPDHTLQATALAHEAYLKLIDQKESGWTDRAHFVAIASIAIRRILVDHARARAAAKRGHGADRVSLESVENLVSEAPEVLIDLDEALDRLRDYDERMARVVEMRFFAGLGVEETGEVLAISPATVKRDWMIARSWLLAQLRRRDHGAQP